MYRQSFNLRATTLTVRNSMSPATAGRGFLLLTLALACFALSPTPKAFGVSPPPDGGYPNNNTAEGFDALLSLTSGSDNTAIEQTRATSVNKPRMRCGDIVPTSWG